MLVNTNKAYMKNAAGWYMKNTADFWRSWIRLCPFTAVYVSSFMTLLVTLAATVGPPADLIFAVGFVTMLGAIMVSVWMLGRRGLLPVLLCVALIGIPHSRAERVAPVVIGGVVVIVGGVIIYKVAKFCQRKFPKNPPNTNDPPAFIMATPGSGTDAAAWTYGSMGSCYVPPPSFNAASEGPAAINFSIWIKADLTPSITYLHGGEDGIQDVDGWNADLAGWGLSMSSNGPSESYSHDGVPVPREASPIAFGADLSHMVSVIKDGVPNVTVRIERSYDLVEWGAVLEASVPVGMSLQLDDVSESSQTFYRVTTPIKL